jgi:probable phosphomutase (TIGR03848 family)
MTTILLIRHGSCAPVGHSIAGRAEGIHLDEAGQAQAAELPVRLGALPISAIYSSPLERARETAAPLARSRALEPRTLDDLIEVDFGRWTGATLDELASEPAWRRFNSWRSITRIPQGEHAAEVQLRGIRAIEKIRAEHPDGTVAVVSHADLIRVVLAYYLGMPLDHVLRLEVAPASISVLEMWEEWLVVTGVNIRGELVR